MSDTPTDPNVLTRSGQAVTRESVFPEGTPEDLWAVVVIAKDGSRRYVKKMPSVPSLWISQYRDDLFAAYPDNPVLLWLADSLRHNTGFYFPYPSETDPDPDTVTEPVNQIPDLLPWRADVATFAHGLDIGWNGRSLAEDGDTRETVKLLVHVLVGHAWIMLRDWAQIDPATDPLWNTTRPQGRSRAGDVRALRHLRHRHMGEAASPQHRRIGVPGFAQPGPRERGEPHYEPVVGGPNNHPDASTARRHPEFGAGVSRRVRPGLRAGARLLRRAPSGDAGAPQPRLTWTPSFSASRSASTPPPSADSGRG